MTTHEDTGSHDEVGAAYAERQRVIRSGEDTDAPDEFAGPSTWSPDNVPQHVLDDVASAPTDRPPF